MSALFQEFPLTADQVNKDYRLKMINDLYEIVDNQVNYTPILEDGKLLVGQDSGTANGFGTNTTVVGNQAAITAGNGAIGDGNTIVGQGAGIIANGRAIGTNNVLVGQASILHSCGNNCVVVGQGSATLGGIGNDCTIVGAKSALGAVANDNIILGNNISTGVLGASNILIGNDITTPTAATTNTVIIGGDLQGATVPPDGAILIGKGVNTQNANLLQIGGATLGDVHGTFAFPQANPQAYIKLYYKGTLYYVPAFTTEPA